MRFHIAQINIARFRELKDHPANADFLAALDSVNAAAEASPGFVWRLKSDGSNSAMDIAAVPDDPRLAVNMSVWTDLDALAAFVYRTDDHRSIMRRRREWMEHMDTYMALWWIQAGQTPSVEDGFARLKSLERLGPSPEAFTFKQPFPSPDGMHETSIALGPLGQIARTVQDIGAAEAFYRDTLGLPHLFTFGDLAFFDCGGVRLMLSRTKGAPPADSILYFKVAHIHAAQSALQAKGVFFRQPPHLIHKHADGTEEWMAFFDDNEGRPLGLMASLP